MYQTTVDTIITQLIRSTFEEARNDKEEFNFYREIYLKHIDVFGKENKHLRLKGDTYSIPRKEDELLKGDEVVTGDVLLYKCSGHDGTEEIFPYSTLEEAKSRIVSTGGIFNSFCTDMKVFYKGSLKPYFICFTDDEGRTTIFNKEVNEDLFFERCSLGKPIELSWAELWSVQG